MGHLAGWWEMAYRSNAVYSVSEWKYNESNKISYFLRTSGPVTMVLLGGKLPGEDHTS